MQHEIACECRMRLKNVTLQEERLMEWEADEKMGSG